MPNLRYGFAILAAVGLVGCKKQETSPYCPQGTYPVAARSAEGKSIWCEAPDKVRAQWIDWHPGTTKPRQSCSFSHGKPEGSFTAWYPDGKPWVQGQFIGGQKAGKWKQWDRAGNQVAEGDYNSGRLVAGAPVASIAGCEKVAMR